jgi:hypothetical protein
MSTRLGLDLSAESAALAHVRERRARPELRGFAVLDAVGDLDAIATVLREVRRARRFPRHVDVVAWPRDPRLDAVRKAGLIVEQVISPGEALARAVRLHQPVPAPGAVTVALSLHVDSGALAIVRDGAVLREQRLAWTTSPIGIERSGLLRRYAFLAELTEHLRGALASVQDEHGAVAGEILTCGSLPDLRSLTMPLAEEFDVDVETLDSVDDIDIRVKNTSLEQMRDWIAALRLAVAAGTRRPPGRGARDRRRIVRVAIPAGVAAALATVLLLWGALLAERSPLVAPRLPAALAPAAGSAPVAETSAVSAPPADPASGPLAVSPSSAESGLLAAEPPTAGAGGRLRERAAGVTPLPARAMDSPSPIPAHASALPASDAASARPAEVRVAASVSRPEPAVTAPRALRTGAIHRDAGFTVTSILWSADRQLAVIGGRILSVGDVVEGTRIVEIQPAGVIVRDRAGVLRRAELGRTPGEAP